MPDLKTAVDLIKDLGYPIAVSIYLLYFIKSQNKFYGERLDDIQNTLVDITTQISYVLSSTVNYKCGNEDVGDILSNQAIYIGNKLKKQHKHKKEGEA